jgi:predicted amidohydrolase
MKKGEHLGKNANPTRAVRFGLVQFALPEKITREKLFSKLEDSLRQAKSENAAIAIFPELTALALMDWNKELHEIKYQHTHIARNFFPEFLEWTVEAAKLNQMYILSGSCPRIVDGQLLNTAIFATPSGEFVLQDKLYLTPIEKEWGWSAGQNLNVVETAIGKIVVLICFDGEVPQISQALAKYEPDVILVPSWTGSAEGAFRVDWTARARAIEHYCYILKTGTASASTDSVKTHSGAALFVGPQDEGFELGDVCGPVNEPDFILFGSYDLDKLHKNRALTGYHPAKEGMSPAPIEPRVIKLDSK